MYPLKRKHRLNIIFALVLILGVTAFSLLNPSTSIRVHIEQEILWIEGPENTQHSIPLASIQEVSFVSDPVYDKTAPRSHNIAHGACSDVHWGNYTLCVDTKIPACLVVESTEGTYVFNFEDLETTQWFYDEFLVYLEEIRI